MGVGIGATLAYTALAASPIGTGVAVYGQIQAGNAQKAQADYQAKVAANNAILTQRAADDARARGKQQEEQAAIQGKQLIGRQRAVTGGQRRSGGHRIGRRHHGKPSRPEQAG